MTMKIIAVAILCIILVMQYVVGVTISIRKGIGCLGVMMFTLLTIFLIVVFYFAGVFNFNNV